MSAASPWVGVWMSLMMQPMSIPFDSTLLIEPQCTPKVGYFNISLICKYILGLDVVSVNHDSHLFPNHDSKMLSMIEFQIQCRDVT